MKKRKAQSKILVTALIILQIIVAFTVIYNVVRSLIKDSSSQISIDKFTSQFEIKEVKLWLTGGASIKVKSNSMTENMNFLKIIFYDRNLSSHDLFITDLDRIPKLYETKIIELTVDEIPINNSDIEKISIYPTDGKNYGLESKEPDSLIKRDSLGNRILDAPPETISWWRFDRTFKDSIGNNHGTLQGDAMINENGELFLDGDGDYADIGHHDNLDIKDNDWTISVWINPENLISSQYIVSKRNIGNFENGQYAIFLYGDKFRAYLFDGYAKNVNGQEQIKLNQWTYLTAVYKKGESLKTYVNGKYDREISISGASYANLEEVPFQIGSVNGTQCFHGLIDDIIVLNKALSGNEIKTVYTNQKKH